MARESNWKWLFAIALIVVFGFLVKGQQGSGSQEVITASGTYTAKVAPDRSDVFVSVTTEAATASASQTQNTQVSNGVLDALKEFGTVSTQNYNLYPVWDYNNPEKPTITGYRTTNTIKLTLTDLTKTGPAIDAAVSAGANQIDYVSFYLSDAKESEQRTLALKAAGEEARKKAEGVAAGLGVKITKVVSASESNFYVGPYTRAFDAGAPAKGTEIAPGDVDVTASITVNYAFKWYL